MAHEDTRDPPHRSLALHEEGDTPPLDARAALSVDRVARQLEMFEREASRLVSLHGLGEQGLVVEGVSPAGASNAALLTVRVLDTPHELRLSRATDGPILPGRRAILARYAGAPPVDAEHRRQTDTLIEAFADPSPDCPELLRTSGPVLLVEFVNADQFPGRVSYVLPIVAGYFCELGSAPAWIRFGVSTTNLMEHRRDEITLTAREEQRLVELAGERDPEVILLTDRLHEPQAARVLAATTGARAVIVGQGEGLALYSLGRDLLPRYDWVPGNAAARQRRINNVYLHFANGCGHPRRVRDNPLFGDPALHIADDQIGCTFCTSSRSVCDSRPSIWQPATGLSEWTGRQVESLIAHSRQRERMPNAILFERMPPGGVLRETVATLRRHAADRDVQLLFAIRTNLVPDLAVRVRGHFDEAPDSPVRFGVYSSGVESFSAPELELYNKATSPLDGLRAINTMRDLARTYGEQFWYTGLSFLLFSPWTTLENLELNFGLIRFLGVTCREAGNIYQSRLRLHEGLPMRGLMEAEGLLDDEVRDTVVVMNRRKLFGQEEPWRCADPRVEPIMSLVLRFDLLDGDHADPLTLAIGEALRSVVPRWCIGDDRSLQQLVLAMIKVARARPEPYDERELLARACDTWSKERALVQEAADRERFRVGEARCGLAELADRVAVLVDDGTVRVVAVDAPVIRPGDSQVIRSLQSRGLTAAFSTTGRSSRRLVIAARDTDAKRHDTLRRHLDTVDKNQRAAAAIELGALLGLPACCAAGLAAHSAPLPWAAFARRNETGGPVPHALLPIWIPAIAFVPCQPDCQAAEAVYRGWFQALAVSPPPEESAWIFSGSDHDDCDLVTLRVTEKTAAGVGYAPKEVRGSDPRLVRRLGLGASLRVLPGQLQVVDQGQVVDCLSATHALWDPQTALHGVFWRELARGGELVASNCGPGGMYRLPFGTEGSPLSDHDEASIDDSVGQGADDSHGEHEPHGAGAADGTDEAESAAARAGPPAPALSGLETRIAQTLRRIAEAHPAARITVHQVSATRQEDTIGILLEVDGAAYELRLCHGATPARYFFRTKHFALSYQSRTPLTSPGHQRRVRALIKALDKAVSGPSGRPL